MRTNAVRIAANGLPMSKPARANLDAGTRRSEIERLAWGRLDNTGIAVAAGQVWVIRNQ
jgi:hypothetical protein